MNEILSLSNQFLVSMPALTDPYFEHSVVYLCEHTTRGAIGLVVNRPLALNLSHLLMQLHIPIEDTELGERPVLCGGPVHQERGFVIHTPSGPWQTSLHMNSEICVTVSEDILQAIAQKQGPQHAIFSLGYASWEKGQLEEEIAHHFWLTLPVDLGLLFKVPYANRWTFALQQLGVNPMNLSYVGGHA